MAPRYSLSKLLRGRTLGALLLSAWLCGCSLDKLSNLGRYPRHPLAIQSVERLVSDDKLLQKEAEVELLAFGQAAMPDLAERFVTSGPEARYRVLEVATEIKQPTPLLVELYAQGARATLATTRKFVAYHSSQFPELASELAPILRPLLHDAVAEVQAAAITTLGNFPSPNTIDEKDLLTLVRSENLQVAGAAAAIAIERPEERVKNAARLALPRLVGGLANPSPATRSAAIFAIGKYGSYAAAAEKPLITIVQNDPLPEIRVQGALALVRVGTPSAREAALPALQEIAQSNDPKLARAALVILKQYSGIEQTQPSSPLASPEVSQPVGSMGVPQNPAPTL
jgi:HEAT repeat protein